MIGCEFCVDLGSQICRNSGLSDDDFFVRLCDLHGQRGKSMNVCDGIVRLGTDTGERQADGTRRVTIELWPNAHRFKKGHSIRLQVSSGSHPSEVAVHAVITGISAACRMHPGT
jgi:predicted acyl esterase